MAALAQRPRGRLRPGRAAVAAIKVRSRSNPVADGRDETDADGQSRAVFVRGGGDGSEHVAAAGPSLKHVHGDRAASRQARPASGGWRPDTIRHGHASGADAAEAIGVRALVPRLALAAAGTAMPGPGSGCVGRVPLPAEGVGWAKPSAAASQLRRSLTARRPQRPSHGRHACVLPGLLIGATNAISVSVNGWQSVPSPGGRQRRTPDHARHAGRRTGPIPAAMTGLREVRRTGGAARLGCRCAR